VWLYKAHNNIGDQQKQSLNPTGKENSGNTIQQPHKTLTRQDKELNKTGRINTRQNEGTNELIN